MFNVNVAPPFKGRAALSVTEHTNAGAAPVQLTVDTPVPATAFTNVTPGGSCSLIVTTWPTAAGVWPLLLIVKLYAKLPPVTTVAGAVLPTVRLIGVLTVVGAEVQELAGAQAAPGVGGVVPPVGSIDA